LIGSVSDQKTQIGRKMKHLISAVLALIIPYAALAGPIGSGGTNGSRPFFCSGKTANGQGVSLKVEARPLPKVGLYAVIKLGDVLISNEMIENIDADAPQGQIFENQSFRIVIPNMQSPMRAAGTFAAVLSFASGSQTQNSILSCSR
jgi:hypothetical protein